MDRQALLETFKVVGTIIVIALFGTMIAKQALAANGAFDCETLSYVQEESKVVACEVGGSGKCFTYGRDEAHDGSDFKFYLNSEPLIVEDAEGNIEMTEGTTHLLIQNETNSIIFRVFLGDSLIGSSGIITCGPANVS